MSTQRGYRSAQGSGAAEWDQALALVASGQRCPGCGHIFRGIHAPDAIPVGLPARSGEGRVLRALGLEPTAVLLGRRVAELVPPSLFPQWFGQLRLIDATAGMLWLQAPPHTARWLQGRFQRLLDAAASDCADGPIRCRVVTAPLVDARTLSELLDADGGAP